MRDYEQKLVNLFNDTLLPNEAKMYVLIKHLRDVQDAIRAEDANKEQKRKESESNEQMSQSDRMA